MDKEKKARILPPNPKCLDCKLTEMGVRCPPCEVWIKSDVNKQEESVKWQSKTQ